MSLVSRACPGLFDEHFIRYFLPQERGWSYVHAWQIERGIKTQWHDNRNPAVRWWNKIKERFIDNGH